MGKTQKAQARKLGKKSLLWAVALTCQYPPLEYCARMQFALAIPGRIWNGEVGAPKPCVGGGVETLARTEEFVRV